MPTYTVTYTTTIDADSVEAAINEAFLRGSTSAYGEWDAELSTDDADDEATTEQALACPACRTQAEQIATHNAVRSGWTGDTDELQGEVDDLIRDSEARCTAH